MRINNRYPEDDRLSDIEVGSISYTVESRDSIPSSLDTPYEDHFRMSLLSCIFCFFPTGLVALCYSMKARDAFKNDNISGGDVSSSRAECWGLLTIVVGICVYIIGIVIGVFALAFWLETTTK